jgi:hypothetical protein
MKRTLPAALRLRVCANVFARSRIHFDAQRHGPPPVARIDLAQAHPDPAPDRSAAEAHALRSGLSDSAPITVH